MTNPTEHQVKIHLIDEFPLINTGLRLVYGQITQMGAHSFGSYLHDYVASIIDETIKPDLTKGDIIINDDRLLLVSKMIHSKRAMQFITHDAALWYGLIMRARLTPHDRLYVILDQQHKYWQNYIDAFCFLHNFHPTYIQADDIVNFKNAHKDKYKKENFLPQDHSLHNKAMHYEIEDNQPSFDYFLDLTGQMMAIKAKENLHQWMASKWIIMNPDFKPFDMNKDFDLWQLESYNLDFLFCDWFGLYHHDQTQFFHILRESFDALSQMSSLYDLPSYHYV